MKIISARQCRERRDWTYWTTLVRGWSIGPRFAVLMLVLLAASARAVQAGYEYKFASQNRMHSAACMREAAEFRCREAARPAKFHTRTTDIAACGYVEEEKMWAAALVEDEQVRLALGRAGETFRILAGLCGVVGWWTRRR